MSSKIRPKEALEYHENKPPGKIEVNSTKSVSSQHDLALAYSPGVAEPCLAIADTPEDVYRYTAKGNLVGVISNGTAVLGLGNIGPEASKPVMEGKGVLFKNLLALMFLISRSMKKILINSLRSSNHLNLRSGALTLKT